MTRSQVYPTPIRDRAYSLLVGQPPVVINCAGQQITQGIDNITGVQSEDSTFWGLLSGQNTIGFSAGAGTGTVQVSFLPVFIGI